MRVLYCTHTSERYVGCASLSDEQVVCGPNWSTRRTEDGYTHIQTPAGRFDIKIVLDLLPEQQKPDMIVVWTDSSCVVQPYNLAAFSGPKVLLIADTHHLQQPIEKVIAYAKAEPWDFLVAFDNRHHLHFFREAGCKNIFWLPGLNASAASGGFQMSREKVITFVGQVGKFHPRRREILSGMQQAGLPVDILQMPNHEALLKYASSLISLECTLNSNIGLRTFEVLSAGGLLLADRPSAYSGMDLLFEEGKHLLYYDSLGDLVEKASYILTYPEKVFPVAMNGYREFWEKHSPEKKRQELMDLVWHGKVNPKYDLSLEPRMKRNLLISGQTFAKRVKLYQDVQELHRNQERVNILYEVSCKEEEVLEDLLDLPRAYCAIIPDKKRDLNENEVIKRMARQCYLVAAAGGEQEWDVRIELPKKAKAQKASMGQPFIGEKHILVYTDDPCLGGAAHFDHSITLGLRRAGYKVSIVQTYNEHERVQEREKNGVRHLWLNYDTIKEFGRTVNQTDEPLQFFQEERPDLIIFSDCCPFSNFAAKRVAIKLGIPFIEVEHAIVPYLAERFAQLLGERERIYRKANAVIAVSKASLVSLQKLFRLPPNAGQVIYLGRPDKFFHNGNLEIKYSIRKQLSIPQDGIICFTAARLDSLKGFDLQLTVIQRLRTTSVWDKLFFVWAGTGDREQDIRRIVMQQGLSGKVHILGNRQDIEDLLDASDVFVLPSFTEGLPLSVMEAMAKKIPVIASRVGGIPEALEGAGILLPDPNQSRTETVAVLVAMLELLALQEDIRVNIGEKCYHKAADMFKEEKMQQDFIEVITRILT